MYTSAGRPAMAADCDALGGPARAAAAVADRRYFLSRCLSSSRYSRSEPASGALSAAGAAQAGR